MSDKKNTTVGVRVDDELLKVMTTLADEEERSLASMTRILIVEALRARGKVKK